MLFARYVTVVRGGGDLGTGVTARLHRAGFPVVVTELASPLTVRRTVALSRAVVDGHAEVEGVLARRVSTAEAATEVAATGTVAVVVDESLPRIGASIVVDARLAKRRLDTTIDDAALVVALGPGFVAGVDCHAVVETARGHHLGRVLWHGSALADTGVPGSVGGRSAERVLRSSEPGVARWVVDIGQCVEAGQRLGQVGTVELRAPFRGVVRGLISDGTLVPAGLKVGDIDPRTDTSCDEISDKALAIGGGVLEAVLTWISARS
jgi:xanthine dehydrogenase accessory factor